MDQHVDKQRTVLTRRMNVPFAEYTDKGEGDPENRSRVSASFDATGKLCPALMVEVNKILLRVKVGEILGIVATDPATKRDIRFWCADTGHVLLDAYFKEADFKYYYLIRRTR